MPDLTGVDPGGAGAYAVEAAHSFDEDTGCDSAG
jgi:hypothetical protein